MSEWELLRGHLMPPVLQTWQHQTFLGNSHHCIYHLYQFLLFCFASNIFTKKSNHNTTYKLPCICSCFCTSDCSYLIAYFSFWSRNLNSSTQTNCENSTPLSWQPCSTYPNISKLSCWETKK